MIKEKISAIQLFYLMAGYVLGTAMILGLGADTKQDAWIYILIGMISSLLLMVVYTQLSTYYSGDTLVQMLPKIIGKFLSYPVILLYIAHFTYSAARGCRELGDLIVSTILTETPILVVIGSFMVLMIYCLLGGVETLGRMAEIVFPIYIFALILIWILLLSVDPFDVKNLTPILGNGVTPLLKKAVPKAINFPFGEIIVIMMFFPFLSNKQNIRKIGLSSLVIGGILLTVNSIMMLSTLGPEIYNKDLFTLLAATQMVSVADFLERFDALVILMMVAGVFFKVGGFTFGASIAISQLFELKQTRSVLIALGLIITPLSLISSPNYVEHLDFGFKFYVPYFQTLLQIIVPILLLFIAMIRKKLGLL
ncbi:endospore germination permease [Bacillus sp. ISL-40]|uniref:GerAB/ArcD/ProY family transporter n=1 Tax=unclassified Bacillus (in: firmicutes) TaxID=185979 RepID=UPI001BECCFB8|nr:MULTISPECIES: endospore germination permease [unclassified Bacillus (in: firmicutes)]MBT2697840.1 endospore germination permease [Bacillus sp. ISL-40]MBT2721571.1 endospore germination permease [Bacillus sp. ISL-46]